MYSQELHNHEMKKTYVIKRNGQKQQVSFDKVNLRIQGMCDGLEVDPVPIAQKVISRIYDGVNTTELDELAAKICASLETENPDYGELAKRIIISNNHKNTSPSFSETIYILYHNKDHGKPSPIVSEELYQVVVNNKEKLNDVINYQRDYNFDFFGFKTLEKAYLKRVNKKIVERIQHLIMRVSLGLHLNNLTNAIKSYELMSQKYFTQATPTLFHSGTPKAQNLSCFLMGTDDSIDGIYKTITDCAKISKWAGGIGVHVSNIRSAGTTIRGTNGKSDGIIPMLKVYNDTAKYVNQCFTPDTLVFTQDKGVQRMDQLTEGQSMVTRDGTFKDINKVFIRELEQPEELICYSSLGSPDRIKCTQQHQIFCLSVNHFSPTDTLSNLHGGIIKSIYKCASDLVVGDYIGFPIPQYEMDYPEENKIFYYLYGCLLNYGRIETAYNYKMDLLNKYFIILDPINESQADKIEIIKNILDEAEIKYTNFYENDKLVIYWKRRQNELPAISWKMLYNKEGKKRVYPDFLNLPKAKLVQILKGLIDDSFNMKTSSPLLAHGVRYLFLKLGVLVGGHSMIALEDDKIYRNFNQSDDKIYQLTIPLDETLVNIVDDDLQSNIQFIRNIDQLGYFQHNKMIYTQINNIDKITYHGPVYDFNMHRNHNYLTQGGLVHNSGKRPGAFAVYLEPHHPDIMNFLELKLNTGVEDNRARDLFYAMWISDLFMERVEADANWSLFDPDRCPGLNDTYGDDYKKLYHEYELEGKAEKTVSARKIWEKICDSQIETGVPYILFKDHINRKSNQKHYGVIRSSNLCAEIALYSDKDEYACCVLASLSLPSFVNVEKRSFDHQKLQEVAGVAIRNLDRIVTINFYPVPETKKSNELHRPLGLGVQGLADVFMLLDLPFDSPEAKELNKQIFETIYYGAVKESIQLAKEYGPYPTYEGSPMSHGKFQFDLWGVTPTNRWDWESLRQEVLQHGIRNSTLIACMPTASTSQILGNNECIEAYTSNIYSRRTIAGDFVIVNKHLVKKLRAIGLWNRSVKDMIVANNGSIQSIVGIPDRIKDIYKTVWEIKQKDIIDMSVDRGPYVCQTQSLNLHFEEPSHAILSKALFYGWKKGIKTGSYYIRGRPKVQAQQFTIDPEIIKKALAEQPSEEMEESQPSEALLCSLDNPSACDSCSA